MRYLWAIPLVLGLTSVVSVADEETLFKGITDVPLTFEGTTTPSERNAPPFEVSLKTWFAASSGWLFITRGGEPGSATRANYDLGNSSVPILQARWKFADSHAVAVRLTHIDASGKETLSSDTTYHGVSYAAGRDVETDLSLSLADFDYQYLWLNEGPLTLAVHAGVHYWSFSGRMKTIDSLTPLSEKRAFSSLQPLVGMDAQEQIGDELHIGVSVLGGVLPAGRHFVESDMFIASQITGSLSVTAGYRIEELRFHQTTNEADMTFQGPFLGIDLTF